VTNVFGLDQGIEYAHTWESRTFKCSNVPEEVVVRFMQAETDKISRNAEMSKKRALDIATKGDIGSFALASSSKQPKITTVCDKQKKAEVETVCHNSCI